MARGANAKVEVENIIRNAFGKNFIGTFDKKLYIQADDGNGEMVQIAISMTCPKTAMPVGGVADGGLDFNNMPSGGSPTDFKPAEITVEETEKIRK